MTGHSTSPFALLPEWFTCKSSALGPAHRFPGLLIAATKGMTGFLGSRFIQPAHHSCERKRPLTGLQVSVGLLRLARRHSASIVPSPATVLSFKLPPRLPV